tara:strand:- start:2856 stop:4205 length:1350 start_codon:yes stop_codon:yes gene_type:complete
MTEDTRPKIDPMAVMGSTGLKDYAGHIYEEWLPELSGDKAVKIYQEMADNDPLIGGLLFMVKTLCRQVNWEIQAAGDTPDAEAVAEFVRGCLFEDMERPWTDTLSEILSFLTYGFSVHEIVYKVRKGPDEDDKRFRSRFTDGRIGWRGFPIRSQDTIWTWDLDPKDGELKGITQQAPPSFTTVYIPADKLLHFRTEMHKNNPEGRSILRNAYTSYWYKKRIMSIESIGVSRNLAGIPVWQVPPEMMDANASAAEKATLEAFKDMVQRVSKDAYQGLVIPAEVNVDGSPTGFKLSLLTGGGDKPMDVDGIIKRHESRILISCAAEFLLLGMDKVGSFALSSNKTALFAQAIGNFMTTIADIINNEAIPKLMQLNGFPESTWPKLTYADIEAPEVQEMATALSALVSSGIITPDDRLEDFVREFADLPQVETETERAPAQPTQEGQADGNG